MRKALSIALMLVTATIAVPAAQADPPEARPLGEQIIAQERAKNVAPAPMTAIQQLVKQERARAGDPALFGPASTPVQIVGPADDFDVRDAGLGGAVALALSLLVAAAFALRRRTPGPASAGS